MKHNMHSMILEATQKYSRQKRIKNLKILKNLWKTKCLKWKCMTNMSLQKNI
jgi:hypothetical protein